MPTWPQLAPQLGAKIHPKAVQEPSKIHPKSHLNFDRLLDRLLIDFWSVFGLNLDAFDPKKLHFSLGKYYFLKTRLSELTSIFDPILVPTWLDFGTQNPPKSTQKSIPRGIKKMMHFCIDFLSILAPTWGLSWGYVGDFFGSGGAML